MQTRLNRYRKERNEADEEVRGLRKRLAAASKGRDVVERRTQDLETARVEARDRARALEREVAAWKERV